MAADNSSGVTETQGKKYIEKAQSAANDVNKRLHDISKQAKAADVE